ncbi:MAG TPA: enoyl-CoA hydratase-related protein [Bdellovibrio sp.]|nr:enoyl-CoA hydratase-related protein [Bdellovibrio sp.]
MKFVTMTEMDQVAYVKLNRPDVRNAFNPEMIAELTNTFYDLSKRKDLRVVVLQGEGKSFCAGADLNWMKEMVNFSFVENQTDSSRLFVMFEAIMKCSLPVVAMVHGAAFGGALGLVAACDEVIAEEGTQFCFSEVKLGIAPAVISAFVARRSVPGKVRPLMISGVVFNSHIAQQAGLVTEVVAVGEGHTAIQKVIQNYKQCGPEAVRETKRLLNDIPTMTWEQKRDRTTHLIAELRASDEGQEGLKSFLEKRDPSWRV